MTVLSVILAVLLLGTGYLAGYAMAPTKVETVETETIKEVPTVVTETETVEVPVFDKSLLLDEAVELFWEEIEDEENLQVCNGVEYDEDQIEEKRLYDEVFFRFDEDETEVFFTTKLKYLDGDVEEKCYNKYQVNVLFEEDEDPVVEYQQTR
ncbi:MAG: hypothetical protein ACTSUC_09730 [Promethearchaeota archaeon]